MTNLKLVQFTFSHAIKADKKRKLKLKISNA